MYLTHHYFVDLIGGAMLSLTVLNSPNINICQNKEGLFCRWSYTEIEKSISKKLTLYHTIISLSTAMIMKADCIRECTKSLRLVPTES